MAIDPVASSPIPFHLARAYGLGAVRPVASSVPTDRAAPVVAPVTARRPKTRYAVGFGAKPMIFMRGLLSDRAFDGFMRMATGISGKPA